MTPRRLSALGLALLLLATAPTSGQVETPAGPAAAELITLNFQDADMEVVLDAVAQAIGFNYVLAPEVRRKVTVQGRVARRELFDVLLAILEVHGLTAVRSGDVYKIIRIATAQAQGLPVVVGMELDPTRRQWRPEEIVTQIVQVSYGSAAEIARVLQPMMSREGTVAVHRDTNVIVLTDAVDKLRRHLRIIRSLDVPTAQEQFQVFPLRFADATALAGLLGQLFAGGPATPARGPAAAPPRIPEPPETVGAAAGGTGPAMPVETGSSRTVILADPRTNTLLATGPPAVLERIQALVTRLDSEAPPTKAVYLYRVEHLRAKELAATLTSLFRRRGSESGEGPGSARPAAPGPGPGGPIPVAPPFPAPPEGERDDLATGDVRVIADEATNTLLVTATASTWAALQPVLQRLDRMPRRILIEVLVAEVTLDDSTSLGIEWSFKKGGIQIGGERLTLGTGLDVGVPGIAPTPPGFFFILQNADILALLQAFSRVNRLNVLSSPHVLTSENKKAQIHVGRSVPVLTTQQQPTTGIAAQPQPSAVITTTVDYRDTGIILTVTPRVSDNRFVALEVRQEVSDAIPNLVSSTQSPVFIKRVAETSVVVAEHETLILGGLIEERKVQEREGIPFLSRIPILGYLFGATTETLRKTELLILVTPRVVLDPAESRSLYEEFKRRTPELKREIEQLPPPPAPESPDRPAAPRSFAPDTPTLASER